MSYDSCHKLKELKRKVECCQNLLNEVTDAIQQMENKDDDKKDLEDSIIIETDNDGYEKKKVITDFGDSFLIMENGKDIEELDKKDQKVIYAQNDFYRYRKTVDAAKGVGNTYCTANIVIGIGKWILPFL